MVYDADGERIIRRSPDGTTTLYLGAMELKLSGNTVTGTRYYSGPDGTSVAMRSPGGIKWLASGLNGSTVLSIDDTTGAVSRERYLPFGKRRGGDDLPFTDRGFLGKIEDDSIGLSYLSARYYDPSIGKFISTDPLLPLDEPQWMNPYGYAGNNPIGLSDPGGLAPDKGTEGESCDCSASAIEASLGKLPNENIRKQSQKKWQAKISRHLSEHLTGGSLHNNRLRTQQELFLAISICEEIGFGETGCGKRAINFYFDGVWARHDYEKLMGSDRRGSAHMSTFKRFGVSPGKNLNLKKPSAANGRSYIIYVIKNKNRVVYVGKASGVDTPEQVLKARFTKRKEGHHSYFPSQGDSEPEIIDVLMSRYAMAGAEQFYMEAYREGGAKLRNIDQAISFDRPKRRKNSIAKLDAFFLEVFSRKR
ncbi:RHS repeat-associated core domain-containing protein [Sinosporangium album]|uniref:RHS repeat-associated core domain-containing protein n=1 Tax=Sinosporangium album TaxID=504805 RepID=A0A1G8IB17_9ACTN|nr:RHS repeat-associated core domain-containing protein [Sinosporangium album]SDI16017.1 RHS repeat-associated core domain-containing protein [Sinosporangium album]